MQSDLNTRKQAIQDVLREAFHQHLSTREEVVVDFSKISAAGLAEIIQEFPKILKPLMAYSGMGSRVFQRDLKIRDLDTYSPKLATNEISKIAELLKSVLTSPVLLETIVEIDRVEFVDKEKRRIKGAWEELVRSAFKQESGESFVKRRFGEKKIFEIDLAYPSSGPIAIAVDVKRIEARRDHQKRSDEIVNKAISLKKTYKSAKFAAFIYYPFAHEEIEIRLGSTPVNEVVFAGEDEESVRKATREILHRFRFGRVQNKLAS